MESKPHGATEIKDIHRIGGGQVENLRLKPPEAGLNPPGISVLKAPTPVDAAMQIRNTFPGARDLHEASRVIGSSHTEAIRQAGFDIIAAPTRSLPNHHRIIHHEGIAGFKDENLSR